MNIVDFSVEWIPQAKALILSNYLEECAAVDALPKDVTIPPLDDLARNGLGAAAVEDGRLLGFLSAYGPWKPVLYTPDTAGVFSPLQAHAVQRGQRVALWRRLYQEAAEKWVKAGAASHSITLHAHDADAREALYLYGFGVRCMDLIRPMTDAAPLDGWLCRELKDGEKDEVTVLRRMLAGHLSQSPSFMQDPPQRLEAWLLRRQKDPPRVFAAEDGGRIIAYIEVQEDGENYISDSPGVMNICGAYCLPQYRGKGAAQAVLQEMILALRREGYTRLGVDCESFNPTAAAFWSKYFKVYTHSVVRRIDENALL